MGPTPTPLINVNSFPAARFDSIGTIMGILTPLLTMGAAVLFLGAMMWSGYTVITASGEPDKLSQARMIAIYAILGLVLVVAALLIVRTVGTILNVDSVGI